MISLYELLHFEDRSDLLRNLTLEDKYQLSFLLSKILNTFHSFNPPLVHGHLSAHNVFIEF
jgi:RIO-like serine/threonine protein kinase